MTIKEKKRKEEKVEEKEEKREQSDLYVHGLIKWVPPLETPDKPLLIIIIYRDM